MTVFFLIKKVRGIINNVVKKLETLNVTFSELHLTEAGLLGAGYFYATFQHFNFAMNLVQLVNSRTSEEQRIAFLKAEEEITKFEPEVILLYTNKERTQLMLQQVKTTALKGNTAVEKCHTYNKHLSCRI